MKERQADIVIVGGGLGGCAAALAAARNGKRVVLTEETDWIGGQLTAQAVPPDEHQHIETHGGTQAYRDLRRRIREYYRRNYPLTETARGQEYLNPGNGRVSRLCHEPRAALAVLEELIAPHRSGAAITVLLRHKPVAAETKGDSVEAVEVRSLETEASCVLRGRYFIDATELGDLLPLTGTEYVTGFESQRETGEPHAPAEAEPHNIQAFTYCFAMDYLAGEDYSIEKPLEYDFWRAYTPQLRPPWPGPLLSLQCTHPITLEPRALGFDPQGSRTDGPNLWLYRRIADRQNFLEGAYPGDICLVNWPQNDYWLGNILEVSKSEAERHCSHAKQLSLSLLYWLQTEAPRPDGGTGWPGLRLRHDVVGTEDGLAKYPYVRESRRIKAVFTVLEQHVSAEARMELTGATRETVKAESFPDSVGVGRYRLDLHPSSGGDNYIDLDSLPFQIPLGALLPQRVNNLLPACKNIGVTHLTNGCYRLHPVEWNIGESVGVLASLCVDRNVTPRGVRETLALLADLQGLLDSQGVERAWPE